MGKVPLPRCPTPDPEDYPEEENENEQEWRKEPFGRDAEAPHLLARKKSGAQYVLPDGLPHHRARRGSVVLTFEVGRSFSF